MTNITLTKTKYNELQERLKYLQTTRRSEISLAIKLAKEFGDLSENAEYSAAKDEQVANESEIARLEETIAHAEIIDESNISTRNVSIGNKVKLLDMETGEEIEFAIVSTLEANSRENKISDKSPIGKALIGEKKNAVVTANTPGGALQFKILNISKA